MARAAAQQMDAARGTVEVKVPASEGKPATTVSKKGAVVQSVVRGAVLTDKLCTQTGIPKHLCDIGAASELAARLFNHVLNQQCSGLRWSHADLDWK